MDKEKQKKVRVQCNSCKLETNHAVLAEHRVADGIDDISWWGEYQIIKCLGCDDISFRSRSGNSEDYDAETGAPVETMCLYPDRVNGREPMHDWEDLPEKTMRVYRETLRAINNEAPVLAAIGLRAVIESVCIDQGMKGKDLKQRIDALADAGHLSRKQADFLHNHRFMGNTAAHEMVAPKPRCFVAALDIAETLLKTIYILPEIADQLKKIATNSKSKSP